jgi:hypothetical protein
MKWPRIQQTAKEGVTIVESVVNAHGSIYRPVHQETDVGIDGYIELVKAEDVSGRLIAVQIKSGDSYVSENENEFVVPLDQRHLDYWNAYMIPVVLICYSPTKQVAAWTSIRDYIERERYHGNTTIKEIRIPFYNRFDVDALKKGMAGLAHARADERILLQCADKCLSENPKTRRDGFSILQAHPDSRRLKITAMFARDFLTDEDVETAKDALFILGYAVGRRRWSFNPQNEQEMEVISYASALCSDLTESEIHRAIELIDGEHFSGPQGLGERCFDVLCCCHDNATVVLNNVASDKSLPMERRANALYMLYQCNDDTLEENRKRFENDEQFGDVYRWMDVRMSAK